MDGWAIYETGGSWVGFPANLVRQGGSVCSCQGDPTPHSSALSGLGWRTGPRGEAQLRDQAPVVFSTDPGRGALFPPWASCVPPELAEADNLKASLSSNVFLKIPCVGTSPKELTIPGSLDSLMAFVKRWGRGSMKLSGLLAACS